MKIDFSAVAIVLLFVAPGYFAYWTRNHFVPRTLAHKGATEEFAGFVVVSAFTRCLLVFLSILIATVVGLVFYRDPFLVFASIDRIDLDSLWQLHRSEAAAFVVFYFSVSCGTGVVLGLPLALSTLNWKNRIWRWLQLGKRGAWLRRQGIRGIIGEQPAIYTALCPDLDERGNEKYVFVEAELRESRGFYAGQVASYSVAKDEEAHKLVLLRNTQYSPNDSSHYAPVPCETVLIDLADVLNLRIQQVAQRQK